jgi:hypothetical protein
MLHLPLRAVALLFAFASAGCAAAAEPPKAEARPALPCAAALPGSRCALDVADGDPPAFISCTKLPDGALACGER